MQEDFAITMKREDFEAMINSAISKAIGKFVAKKDNEIFFSADDAAKYLKINPVTLWRKRQEGKIEAVQKGRLHLYTKSSLDAYLASNTKEVVNEL